MCFPYAGGGGAPFRRWLDDLPGWVELWTADLPGRERRISEPAADRVDSIVAGAVRSIDALDAAAPPPDPAVPVGPDGVAHPAPALVLLGHSMGAFIAFELAHELIRLGRPAPAALVVSAARAPQLDDPHPRLHDLPDDEFLAAVGRLDGTPPVVFEDEELRRLVLPTLRADFTAVETYRHRDRPPLPCPILAYAALDDAVVTPSEMEPWSDLTSAGFELRTFPGGHFFLQDDPGQFVDRLAADLRIVVPEDPLTRCD